MSEKDQIHKKELEDFLKLTEKEAPSKQKRLKKIFKAFLDLEEHISPEELYKKLKREDPQITLEEVQEALSLLCRLGLASKKDFFGKNPLFEHRHLGEHHDHLICTKCGKIQDFFVPSLEKLKTEIARKYGFKPLEHRLEIYGLCEKCQKKRARPSLPLALVSSGEKVKVERFLGGPKMKQRLAAMGLLVGTELEIINNCGPVIVSVKGSRLALGQGIARKILVSPID